jgi:hypothetical protein
MAEGIDIRVSASGAAATQQALQGVAGAEQQVASAAKGTAAPLAAATAAQKDHGQAIDFNRGAYKEFRQALGFLGPEFAAVGEAVQALTMRHGQAAVGLGLLSASLVGVNSLYQGIVGAAAKADAAEKASLDALKEKRDAYVALAEQIEKMIVLEARQLGRTPTASPEALLAQASEVGTRIPMGKAGVEFMAKAMAARGGAMSGPRAELFAAWIAAGGAEGLKPEQGQSAFDAEMGGPGGADKVWGDLAAFERRFPGTVGPRLAEVASGRGGQEAASITQAIFDRVAKAESDKGRPRTPEQIRNYIDALVQGERSGAGRSDFGLAAREILAAYPELGQVRVQSYAPAGAVDTNYVRRRPVLPGEEGQTNFGTIVNFQGGSHVHLSGMDDPSGEPLPGTISYTGR